MILVGGENLIDFIQIDETSALPEYRANPGGSPYNCAKALARQQQTAGYLTPISNDSLGQLLASSLETDGVQILGPRLAAPTSLAVVSLKASIPTYQFYREGTAERLVDLEFLNNLVPESAKALHVGSLALTHGDDADAWADFFVKCYGDGIFTTVDPNIRAAFIPDRDSFSTRLNKVLKNAGLVKLSDEDLEWLAPGIPLEKAAKEIFDKSLASLVVVTKGGDGAFAITADFEISVPVVTPRKLADTVGAGDTFMATLIAQLSDADGLSEAYVASLNKDQVERLLLVAGTAAAMNCEHFGCNPPTKSELLERLAKNA